MSVIAGVTTSVNGRLTPDDGLLVSMTEHFDPFYLDWQMKHPLVWRDRIPMGSFAPFNGTSQKSYIFRGVLGPQAGLADWTKIAPSSKPVGDSPGVDACTYNPQTYTWGYDAIDYSGLKTSWKSPVFCVNDLQYQDKAIQQLGAIIKASAQVTDAVKETFNRETYVQLASSAGKFVVMADGVGISFIDSADARVTYDPTVEDADGDTYITFPATLLTRISTLNWSQLELVHAYLTDQCPDAAQGNDSGQPIFGLMLDVADFGRMVYSDEKLRDDFHYAKPQQLIAGFDMGFKVYRGFALMHDVRQMRFSVSKVVGTTVTAKRVLPRRATTPGIIGYIPTSNPAYLQAELGTAVVFLNEAVQILVPSPISSLGSGMTFGPAPGFGGEWTWLNIQDAETNPLREIGYFFSRYEYYPRALQYAQDVVVMLYRRCVTPIKTGCIPETLSDAAAAGFVSKSATAAEFDATNNTVWVTLANRLTAGVGAAVTMTLAGGTTYAGTILDSASAPVYKIGWVTGGGEPSAETDFVVATPQVSKVTVV